MKKIELNGQEGYFLTEKEHQQVLKTINNWSDVCKKVIQNANNS